MKRSIAFVTVLLLVLSALPLQVLAAEAKSSPEDTIYFADGSYIVVETTAAETRAANTKTATRTYVHYRSNGVEDWRAVLRGAFSYNGTTSTCTSSSCSVSITDTDWFVVSKTASKAGDTAYAELTMGRKILGITISKKTINMSLGCDKNGNLI